jgi:Spy/CpxP family protein refolding chaperone
MRQAFKRIGLGIGALAIAIGVAGAGYQNLSAQGPGPGGPMGRRGGPGGPGGPGRPGGPGMIGPMLFERLDLTSDQRDRVKQILDSHRDEQKALADRGMKAHEALQDAVTGPFDESGIRARAADVAAVDADMAVAQGRVYGELVQILTPDQQQKLKTIQADMKARAEKMRAQGRPGGGRRGPQ